MNVLSVTSATRLTLCISVLVVGCFGGISKAAGNIGLQIQIDATITEIVGNLETFEQQSGVSLTFELGGKITAIYEVAEKDRSLGYSFDTTYRFGEQSLLSQSPLHIAHEIFPYDFAPNGTIIFDQDEPDRHGVGVLPISFPGGDGLFVTNAIPNTQFVRWDSLLELVGDERPDLRLFQGAFSQEDLVSASVWNEQQHRRTLELRFWATSNGSVSSSRYSSPDIVVRAVVGEAVIVPEPASSLCVVLILAVSLCSCRKPLRD